MSKKDTSKRLTPEEYWEWRSSIEILGRKKSEVATAESEAKIISLEAQIKQLQLQLHARTRLESAKKSVETALGEYQILKSRIESRLGISLNGKGIDEITFEVRNLPE